MAEPNKAESQQAAQNVMPAKSTKKSSVYTERIPAGIDIGMTLYIKPDPSTAAIADKVEGITIRAESVSILFESKREIDAREIGKIIQTEDK